MKVFDTKGLPDRFLSKVDVDLLTGCWLWKAGLRCGYGLFWFDGSNTSAHRFAYTVAIGPVPDGLVLDHLCRTKRCCNPWHLEAVTSGENTRRGLAGLATGELNKAKKKCPAGHDYAGENLVIRDGRRWCRECNKIRSKAWRLANG